MSLPRSFIFPSQTQPAPPRPCPLLFRGLFPPTMSLPSFMSGSSSSSCSSAWNRAAYRHGGKGEDACGGSGSAWTPCTHVMTDTGKVEERGSELHLLEPSCTHAVIDTGQREGGGGCDEVIQNRLQKGGGEAGRQMRRGRTPSLTPLSCSLPSLSLTRPQLRPHILSTPAPILCSPCARWNFFPFRCCFTSTARALSSSPVSAQNRAPGRFLEGTMKGS